MIVKSRTPRQFAHFQGFCAAIAMGGLVACGSSPESTGSVAAPLVDRAAAAEKSPSMDPSDAVSRLVTSRNACKLLTRADAETAVGQPLPQNTVANEVQGMCDYNATDFSAGASLTLGDWQSIQAAATSGKIAPTRIVGVGDEALSLSGSNGATLYVRRGDEGFLISLNGPNIDHLPDHGMALEKALALKVLAQF
jgi:hypothetical protein